MQNYNITRENCTIKQLILPLDLSVKINKNDPVVTFDNLINKLDLNKYFSEDIYMVGRKGYKSTTLLKIVLFGYMINIRSLRELESACKNDIRFMWLSDNIEPSHQTLGNFINKLKYKIEDIFYDLNKLIINIEGIELDTLFIDGTKIEASSNKYSFVWKNGSITFKNKLIETIKKEIDNINLEINFMENYEYKINENSLIFDLEYIKSDLEKIILDNKIEFRNGKGKRKTAYQRHYEKISSYIEKLKRYNKDIKICGKHRNSYSKTDTDATFMRIKTDYMGNDRLLPAYNMQIGLYDEYIFLSNVYQYASDSSTYKELMELYKDKYGKYLKRPVCDAGYGNYSNYIYNKERKIELFQKYPAYKKDIELKEKNKKFRVEYFKKIENKIFCPNGEELKFSHYKKISHLDYDRKAEIYKVDKCSGCPFINMCNSNGETKYFNINNELTELHKEARYNLNTPEGNELKKQRAIQAEGAFGIIKSNTNYDRITRKGLENVKMEWLLISIGYNLMKFHRKKERKIN